MKNDTLRAGRALTRFRQLLNPRSQNEIFERRAVPINWSPVDTASSDSAGVLPELTRVEDPISSSPHIGVMWRIRTVTSGDLAHLREAVVAQIKEGTDDVPSVELAEAFLHDLFDVCATQLDGELTLSVLWGMSFPLITVTGGLATGSDTNGVVATRIETLLEEVATRPLVRERRVTVPSDTQVRCVVVLDICRRFNETNSAVGAIAPDVHTGARQVEFGADRA